MKELYELVVGSPELLARFAEICEDQAEDGPEAVAAAVLAFAEELGYCVTMTEIKAFFEGLQKGGELSEEELDMVAGGAKGPDTAVSFLLGWLSGCD